MSLGVWLEIDYRIAVDQSQDVYVREVGRMCKISRAEWDRRYPGREPVTTTPEVETSEVYWGNITHNLGKMAREAGIYQALWRPEELNITQAYQLVGPLSEGLKTLGDHPSRFREFNPSNGWGTYEGLVQFATEYRDACIQYPSATVRVSR